MRVKRIIAIAIATWAAWATQLHADPLRDWTAIVSLTSPDWITVPTAQKPHLLPQKRETCFPVQRITVDGVTLLPRSSVRRAVASLAHNCLGNTLVKAMLVKINGLHAEAGYVTTQGYLPQQNIKRLRTLRIVVRTGRVGQISYSEQPAWTEGTYFGRLARRGQAVFSARTLDQFFDNLDRFVETIDDPVEQPLVPYASARLSNSIVVTKGEPLELEALQQSLDQMNRAASSKAKLKLEAGKEPATSDVKITNTPADSFRMTVGYDTYGTETTGVHRARVDLARDNLIGFNDTWSASLTSARNANESVAAFSIPFGWLTFSAGGTYSESLIGLTPAVELFTQSLTWTTDLGATVVRRRTRRLDVSAGIKVWDNVRHVNAARLTPQKIFTVHAGGSHRWTIGRSAVITVGLRGYLGLKGMGATQDPESPGKTSPRAQYRMAEATFDAQWAALKGVTLTSHLKAQWSSTPLYSDNQLTLGSETSIRGFKTEPLSVDRGGLWRNEVAIQLPVDWMFKSASLSEHRWFANRLKVMTGYGFVDTGYGQDLANARDDLLVGVGGGIRYRDSRISADLSYARGVYRAKSDTPDENEIYLNIAVKVF